MKLRATTPRAASLGFAAALASLLAASQAAGAPAAQPRPAVARGKFLVATEKLVDPNFRETVILMLEYETHGALGVVINRPTDVKLALVLPDVEELRERPETVFIGGPVARDRMVLLVRTGQAPEDSERVLDEVFVTSSLDVLRRTIRDAKASDRFRAFVGYAGWAPQQLDEEIARGDWNVTAGDPASVFEKEPAELWRELNERAGGQWVRAPAAVPATVRAAATPAQPPPLRLSARSAAMPCRRRRGTPRVRRRSP
ncbi:MAG: YqgE/AlgH family protein [Thermodesulfobacteriota bacterium]